MKKIVILFAFVLIVLFFLFLRKKYLDNKIIFLSVEKINQLHPIIKEKVKKVVESLKKEGVDFKIYSSFRNELDQLKEYGKGRSAEQLIKDGFDKKYSDLSKKIVTNAKPFESYHNYGLAFDGVEIVSGKPDWSFLNKEKIVLAFKKEGFGWGGDFVNLKDLPHFEFNIKKISELKNLLENKKIDENGFVIF